MRKIFFAILAVCFIATTAYAQVKPGLIHIKEVDGSPEGWVYEVSVTNGGLTVSGATAAISLSAGAGQPVTLDLANGGDVESADLGKIATTGDTNSIFTESAADALLIDVSKAWPLATLATTASAGDSATAFFSAGTVEIGVGGTGSALTDPGAHRLWGWDNTTNAIAWFTIGTGLTYTQATGTLSASGGGDVSAASALTALALVQGDDGAKGVKTSAITLDANSNITIGGGAQATQTITGNVSGTDTILTFGNGIINASTGTLQAGGYAVFTTNSSTISAANLAAALTFSEGDLLDFSAITMSAGVDEGLALPTYADVAPANEKYYVAYDASNNALMVRESGGWVNVGASAAAPTNAHYVVTSTNANLSEESVLTAGTGMDITDAGGDGGAVTLNFDSTEIGTTTWGSGSAVVWTFDASGGTDTTVTFGDNLITVGHPLTVTGVLTANGGIVMGTGDGFTVNSVNLLSGDELDGTKIKDADYGDVTISAGGAWAVEDDSHAHGSTTLTLASTNLSDTTNLARLDASNTFTGTTNTVGNADTDILAVQATLRGVGRAVSIDDDTTTVPTYATGVGELFVAGDIETAGMVYSAGLSTGTGTDGTRAITMATNTALTPAGDQIYYINDVLYFSQAGVEKTPMRLQDAQTATGKKTFQGDIAVGDTSNAGTIDIYDGSANYWQLAVPSLSADYTLTLPDSAGATGQYLKTTTTGASAVLSWDTPSASADTTGGTGGVQFNAAGVLTSDAGFVFTTATDKLALGSSGGATTGTLDLYYTGTAYAATLTPNASMSGDVTITMPSYTTTLIGSGANAWTGLQTFTGSGGLTAPPITTSIQAVTAGGATIGTGALPFSSVYIGDAATNNIQLTNTDASSAKVATFPNVTGTVVVGATSTTATQAMFATATAGAPAFRAVATSDLPAALPATSTFATSIAIGADPSETGAIMLSNGAVIGWEDATEATITHVDNTGLKFNLPVILANDETISNADDTEIAFNGTESIALDLDTGTANEVAWKNKTTGSTSVDTMNFSALNMVTTGTINGAIKVEKDDDSLAAAQCYGTFHWLSGGAETVTLPAAVVGMNLCVYASDATVKNIDPNGTDTIVLTTAALTAGYQIESPGAAGDFICLVSFTANQWTALGRSGVWITHGAD